jgi:hypothetical protein
MLNNVQKIRGGVSGANARQKCKMLVNRLWTQKSHSYRDELQHAFSILFHRILERTEIQHLKMSKSLKKIKNRKGSERVLQHPRSVTYRKL